MSECGFQTKVAQHCTCCGVRVLGVEGGNQEYRRIHFKLASLHPPDPGVTFCTFCVSCSAHEWNRERLDQLQSLLIRSWLEKNPPGPSHDQMERWYSGMQVLGVDHSYPTLRWHEV